MILDRKMKEDVDIYSYFIHAYFRWSWSIVEWSSWEDLLR